MTKQDADRPIARLNAWLRMTTKMTGLTERVVLDRLLESEKKRESVARYVDVTARYVFAWANDQRIHLVFDGAVAS